MINLDKLTQYFLLLLLFSPILSYYTLTTTRNPITYYTGPIIVGLGILYFLFSKKKLKVPNYAWWLLLFYFFELVIFHLSNQTSLYYFMREHLLGNVHFQMFIALIMINNCKFDERFISKAIFLMKITVIIAVIVSVIQIYKYDFFDSFSVWLKSGANVYINKYTYQNRRSSIFSYINMNELGLSYIPLLSVLAGFLLINRSKRLTFFLALGGITAVLSNARYVIIAFIIILFQILVAQKKNLKSLLKYFIYATIIIFVLFQSLIFFNYDVESWYNERLFHEGAITETVRYKAFETFSKFFQQHAILGTGGLTQEIERESMAIGSSQIHVGYLSAMIYYGVVGSFFLFGFWFLLTKSLYKNAKKTNYWGSFFAFLVFLWANASLVTFHIFFYGIIFALVFDKFYTDKLALQIKINSNKEPDGKPEG